MSVSEWRRVSLGELAQAAGGFIRTGPFGSQLHSHEYTDDPFGVPVVMPKNMARGRVDRRSVSRVDETTAERLRAHRLVPGDLVLARRGDVGRLAFIEDDEAGWLCGTGAMRVHAPDRTVVWPDFLRHAMRSPRVVEWLAGQAVGATMPNLNRAIVSRLPLRVPSLPTQRRVAALLAVFDDLIEINERRIELLEQLARSLYREWFVRCRFPGAPPAQASALPRGWRIALMGELCDAIRGRSYKRSELSETEGVLFLNLKCVDRGGGFRPEGLKRYTGRFKEIQKATAGDLLVAITDMTQERRIVAQTFRMPDLVEPFAIPSLDLVLMRPRSPDLRAYVYAYLRYSDFAERVRHFANGANVLHLSVERILEDPMVVPDDRTLVAFTRHMEVLLNASEFLAHANRRLAHTRELLLPRLVTGRFDISDIDFGELLPAEAA